MCGIGALFDPWGRDPKPQLRGKIGEIMRPIRHRGPDGEGVYVEADCEGGPSVALGHRRLSILDLSEAGHQPMQRDNRFVISFNGEIYNYRELRVALVGRGFSFQSDCDTEVLLAAYAAWGESMLSRLNGMWAFVIWDRLEQRLFAARDRFGVKPMFWALLSGELLLASEAAQLLPFLQQVRPDLSELGAYLYAGKVGANPERTFFENLHSLPPGCFLSCSREQPQPRTVRWYHVTDAVASLEAIHSAELYADLLSDSVRIRLRSDVPVGSCLSGGLDSSMLVMLASRLRGQEAGPLHCIHALANEPGLDESAYARIVASEAGAQLHCVAPGRQNVWTSMDDVISAQQEPFASPSIFLQYFVMAEARAQGCTVMLDGQGADETLLGYSKYIAPVIAQAWMQGGVAAVTQSLRQCFMQRSQLNLLSLFKLLAGMKFAGPRLRFARSRMAFLSLPMASTRELYTSISRASSDPLQTQLLDIFHMNLPALLRYEDRNSMAHSIEARLPFLDYRVVEAALAMPLSARIYQGWSKYPLRRIDVLPESVRWRTTKLAFNAPDRTWLAGHPQLKQRVLDSPLIASICNRRALEHAWPGLSLLEQWRLFNTAAWAELLGVIA